MQILASQDFKDFSSVAEELYEVLASLRTEDLPKFKELFRVVVPKILVESRSALRPFVHLPLVRIMANRAHLTVHNANHPEISSDLLKVEWSDLRGDPEGADQRSEIQRRRHAEEPRFHEAALRGLEQGRAVQAWSEEQILQAIRDFHTRVGRPPAYEEFRKKYGLPDYKTVWRKFGSSRVAVAMALGPESDHAP